ncbi:hypothetical protein [Pseudomonas coronafaciens]|uniref:Uncharacterized protein n=1 Tax=Pseudomonas coronafaciens pv. coronafaciens TaxID=235275 RepID=A0AAE6QGL4_9PSED|nr:hypothetical protein [Pseudomonas coronafaciens]QGT80903.1 hypothetical protein GMO17_06770 [Pseudomonas coronafaciens pv. coronafaciens]RMS09431.1 hypothetical protein ALP72_04456 [Pseudomonas coronafaciens pv. coronafaciens]
MLAPSTDCLENRPRAPLSKGRPGSRVTFFPSRKNHSPITCGNLMQADYCVYLEYRHDVHTYQCRPSTVCKGELHCKADFLVALSNGLSMYHKFMLPDDQASPHMREKTEAIEAMLQEHGVLLRWLVQDQLPQPLVTQNLRYLYHHSFNSSKRAALEVRAQVVAQAGQQATIAALLARGLTPADISHAIFLDELRINLEHKLTPETMIYGGHDGHL